VKNGVASVATIENVVTNIANGGSSGSGHSEMELRGQAIDEISLWCTLIHLNALGVKD